MPPNTQKPITAGELELVLEINKRAIELQLANGHQFEQILDKLGNSERHNSLIAVLIEIEEKTEESNKLLNKLVWIWGGLASTVSIGAVIEVVHWLVTNSHLFK